MSDRNLDLSINAEYEAYLYLKGLIPQNSLDTTVQNANKVIDNRIEELKGMMRWGNRVMQR